jgi:multidrug efflux pump subunit AcrA (membrane-fusion protein)
MILRKNFENALKLLFVLLLCLSLTVGYAQDQDEATPVTITEVASTNVAPSVPAAGTVFSRNETQVTAGMAGRVEWLAEPGDYIESGSLVAVFDCEMLELQRERQLAEADRAAINFETLSSEVNRFKSVRDANVISEMQLDRTAADRDLAGSDLRIAKRRDATLTQCGRGRRTERGARGNDRHRESRGACVGADSLPAAHARRPVCRSPFKRDAPRSAGP